MGIKGIRVAAVAMVLAIVLGMAANAFACPVSGARYVTGTVSATTSRTVTVRTGFMSWRTFTTWCPTHEKCTGFANAVKGRKVMVTYGTCNDTYNNRSAFSIRKI